MIETKSFISSEKCSGKSGIGLELILSMSYQNVRFSIPLIKLNVKFKY